MAANGYDNLNTSVVNDYTINPKNITQYHKLRGMMDFTQLGQFDQFESGYANLVVLQAPRWIEACAAVDPNVANMLSSFVDMLEFEFRGLNGLTDITVDTLSLQDGNNEMRMISNVSKDMSVTISMPYYEKKGGLITKFSTYYLTGIKDPNSKAKTYHGAIRNNLCPPGFENEVFTMLYYITDNTMLRLEKAYLLCNCQLTTAQESEVYNYTKGTIENKELNVEFNCYPVTGTEVDRAAKTFLEEITNVGVAYANTTRQNVIYTPKINGTNRDATAVLDSTDYLYGIMNEQNGEGVYIKDLVDARNKMADERVYTGQ
jgi:hypothetical protein